MSRVVVADAYFGNRLQAACYSDDEQLVEVLVRGGANIARWSGKGSLARRLAF